MDYKGLEDLHNFLNNNFESYICMIGIGSIATEDKITSKSDKDINLVFETLHEEIYNAIRERLENSEFDSSYLFNPFEKDFYVKNKNSSHDFSKKFRSKTLFGEDISKELEIPSQKYAENIYRSSIEGTYRQIKSRIMNSPTWNDKDTKETFYKLFKHVFMLLAIRNYAYEGDYPRNRSEIAEKFNSKELKESLIILENIERSNKLKIIQTAQNLEKWLKKNR